MKHLLILLALLNLPASAGYVAPPSGSFTTSTFEIKDSTDPTKKLKFSISNQTGDTFTIGVNGTLDDNLSLTGGAVLTDSGTASLTNKIFDTDGDTNLFGSASLGGANVFFRTKPVGFSAPPT